MSEVEIPTSIKNVGGGLDHIVQFRIPSDARIIEASKIAARHIMFGLSVKGGRVIVQIFGQRILGLDSASKLKKVLGQATVWELTFPDRKEIRINVNLISLTGQQPTHEMCTYARACKFIRKPGVTEAEIMVPGTPGLLEVRKRISTGRLRELNRLGRKQAQFA